MLSVSSFFLVIFVSLLIACAARGTAPSGADFLGWQTIPTFDGYNLHADGYRPSGPAGKQRYPLVIFANSWGRNETEYEIKAKEWAEYGYVTLEYETRGWYESGGLVDVAGPLDRRDISTVIDYAFSKADEWNINTSAVAFAGISYGGGLATEAAGFEPRISAIIAMSGWGNLTRVLFDHDTVNFVWGSGLMLLEYLDAHPNPELLEMWNNLVAHRNMSAVEAWAGRRSGQTNVSFMNERKIPFFMSNNFLDRLMKASAQVDFWQELEGPKLLLLNQGIHAQPEHIYNTGFNYIWHQARRWLDYWLKGEQNGILAEAPVQVQPKYGSSNYINLTSWPPSNLGSVKFVLGQRGPNKYGTMNRNGTETTRSSDIVYYDEHSGVNNGIPMLSDLVDYLIPEMTNLQSASRSGSIIYLSEALSTGYQICGTPNISLSFVPSSDTWQVYAMLYDVDALDIGEIITDMHFTRYGAGNPNNQTVTLKTSFHMLYYSIPAGHRLGVAIILYNDLYLPANRNLTVAMEYGTNTWVSIPTLS
jgi:predicted acyl esterase